MIDVSALRTALDGARRFVPPEVWAKHRVEELYAELAAACAVASKANKDEILKLGALLHAARNAAWAEGRGADAEHDELAEREWKAGMN